jgi:SOS-response transcriptional repressor LexA
MSERGMTAPSPKQLELLRQLFRFQQKHGYSPTLEELGRILGISKVTVYQYVRALEHKGLVHRLRNRARSLQFTQEGRQQDLLGERAPTWKLVGILHAEGKIRFFPAPRRIEPDLLIRRYGNVSLLKISGTFAHDPSLRDGDYLLIKPLDNRSHRLTALVQSSGGKIELCELHRRHGQLYASAGEKAQGPRVINQSDVLGVVVGLIRTY